MWSVMASSIVSQAARAGAIADVQDEPSAHVAPLAQRVRRRGLAERKDSVDRDPERAFGDESANVRERRCIRTHVRELHSHPLGARRVLDVSGATEERDDDATGAEHVEQTDEVFAAPGVDHHIDV
jgi:hypothetical protein